VFPKLTIPVRPGPKTGTNILPSSSTLLKVNAKFASNSISPIVFSVFFDY